MVTPSYNRVHTNPIPPANIEQTRGLSIFRNCDEIEPNSQILAMAGIGLLGSISKHFLKIHNPLACSIFAGGFGLVCALLYDGVTTLTYPISAGYDWDETVAYAISGLLFTFMHLVSNAIIFSLVVPGYLRRISQ